MKLNFLIIIFQDSKDFFAEVDMALKSGKGMNRRKKNTLTFDSIKTYNNFMTVNKVQILRAISQLRPESIYQLATLLGREPQHVLKDCRHLESFKFIKLQETDSGRSSLKPVLAFEYDIIRVQSSLDEFCPISEASNKVLLDTQAS